jgi:hypothetical protein
VPLAVVPRQVAVAGELGAGARREVRGHERRHGLLNRAVLTAVEVPAFVNRVVDHATDANVTPHLARHGSPGRVTLLAGDA